MFQLILSTINEGFFQENKKNKLAKIAPKLDIELSDSKKILVKPKYPDLELGLGSIIQAKYRDRDVVITKNGLDDCKILENYLSFMEIINYLSTPIKDRNVLDTYLSFMYDEENENEGDDDNQFPKYKKDIEDNNLWHDRYIIDIPLHLPVNGHI